jgi:hypothetical protein
MWFQSIALAAALALTSGIVAAPQQAPLQDCPVTTPNRHAPPTGSEPMPPGSAPLWHGNSFLGTALWPQGRVVFRPDGPGTVLPDGALRMKFFWLKRPGVALKVSGHRLDDAAVQLRAEVNGEFTPQGIQPSYLIFSTPGCWRVTATAGAETLSFITSVVKTAGSEAGRTPHD